MPAVATSKGIHRAAPVLLCLSCVPVLSLGQDNAHTDAGLDAGSDDAGAPDAGIPDAGVADAGVPDAGAADAGVPDAGAADAGASDAGAADAGHPDAGLPFGLLGAPFLVRNLGTTPFDYRQYGWAPNPHPFMRSGNLLFFGATEPWDGYELWKTDGTAAGTSLVRDIWPGGPTNQQPDLLLADLNGTLLFNATDGVMGVELWRSDGTADGTQPIVDLNPGPGDSNPSGFVIVGTRAFFAATDGVHGTELFVTDGTAAGTALVLDINPGPGSSSPSELANSDGHVYFHADDGTHGAELWTSDGTPAGTKLVADLVPGATSSSPDQLTPVDGGVVFTALNQLWFTSGSTPTLVTINPDAGSNPYILATMDGRAYVQANDGAHGYQLWRTDGANASLAANVTLVGGPAGVLGHELIFVGSGGSAYALWKTDGTPSGSVMLGGTFWVNPPFAQLGGRLFYASNSALLSTDGTGPSTYVTSAECSGLYPFGSALFFGGAPAGDGIMELYRSDGTGTGTGKLAEILPVFTNSWANSLVDVNGTLLFLTDDGSTMQLWRTDGTAAGTTLLNSFADTGRMLGFHGLALLFTDRSGTFWADGTDAGAQLLGYGPTMAFFTVESGGFLYASQDNTLLRTDGSDAGFVQVATFTKFPSYIAGLFDLQGTLLLDANDGPHGRELWTFDSDAGLRSVRDINPATDGGGSDPQSFAALGNVAFFSADDGAHGRELWKSDVTTAGTVLVADLRPGDAGSSPDRLTTFGSAVFFSADDGVHGAELWKTDGVQTVLVRDINPGPIGSSITAFAATSDTLYLVANDGAHGSELWQTDGTMAGTTLVADLAPGRAGSAPTQLMVLPDQSLVFTASNGPSGNELWVLAKGSTTPTLPGDIAAGTASANPVQPTVSGGKLYFRANDRVHGEQLWAVPLAR
jgi:ELWxxDGT repeat protein